MCDKINQLLQKKPISAPIKRWVVIHLHSVEKSMEKFKKKIIGSCLIVGVLMTLFPPMIISEFRRSPYIDKNAPKFIEENVSYRFIGAENKSDYSITTYTTTFEETQIAFDRLLLQYLILIGAGFAFYFLKSPNEDKGSES